MIILLEIPDIIWQNLGILYLVVSIGGTILFKIANGYWWWELPFWKTGH